MGIFYILNFSIFLVTKYEYPTNIQKNIILTTYEVDWIGSKDKFNNYLCNVSNSNNLLYFFYFHPIKHSYL